MRKDTAERQVDRVKHSRNCQYGKRGWNRLVRLKPITKGENNAT